MGNAPKAKAGHKAYGHSELQLKGCQLCRSCRCRQHSRELSQLHSEIELNLSDDGQLQNQILLQSLTEALSELTTAFQKVVSLVKNLEFSEMESKGFPGTHRRSRIKTPFEENF